MATSEAATETAATTDAPTTDTTTTSGEAGMEGSASTSDAADGAVE
jgi:hypothetical protein